MARNLNRLIFGLLLTLVLAFNVSAHGQQRQVCNERTELLRLLAEKYQETTIIWRGIGPNGNWMIETIHNSDSGSWTTFRTSPKGLSCLIVTGQGSRLINEETKIKLEPKT